MISTFIDNPRIPMIWIDITDPTDSELESAARRYGLHSTSVLDCLQPDHLPKLEAIGETRFVIARLFDRYCGGDADTVQKLTRKIALFWGGGFIITIHRVEMRFLEAIRAKWDFREGENEALQFHILIDIVREAIMSYELPLGQAEQDIGDCEEKIFHGGVDKALIEVLYRLRRKTNIYGKMLSLTEELLSRFSDVPESHAPYYQDLREAAHKMRFSAEHLNEMANSLLNIHLSLSSHRASEVMRVLTLFSVFFMPLTFIAGVYGMNFAHMPELHFRWGYPAVVAVMVMIAAGIFMWFRRSGWMK